MISPCILTVVAVVKMILRSPPCRYALTRTISPALAWPINGLSATGLNSGEDARVPGNNNKHIPMQYQASLPKRPRAKFRRDCSCGATFRATTAWSARWWPRSASPGSSPADPQWNVLTPFPRWTHPCQPLDSPRPQWTQPLPPVERTRHDTPSDPSGTFHSGRAGRPKRRAPA